MHMHQVMIALYHENPDAFTNGNINQLKSGSTLKLTDIDSIKAISKSRAKNLIQQYSSTSRKKNTQIQITNTDTSTNAEESRLQTSDNNNFLTAEVPEEIHQEQIINLKDKLKDAQSMIQDLNIQNKKLLDRISSLESEINKTTKALFSPSSQKKISPQPE